jgi:FKBP12-rapamycin complex-associated protein
MTSTPLTASAEQTKLVNSIRAASAKAETRAQFIDENVAKAQELQRKDLRGRELFVQSVFRTLETFQMSIGNAGELVAGLTAVHILLRVELSSSQLSACSSFVRVCMYSASDVATVLAATEAFGESLDLMVPSDNIRKLVDDALSWITLVDSRSEVRKMCGLFVLSQVLHKMPVMFIPRIIDFFERIWTCLADPINETRERALTLFTQAIGILNTRPKSVRLEVYASLFQRLRTNLGSKNVDVLISGLMAFEPTLIGSISTCDTSKYDDVVVMLAPLQKLDDKVQPPLVRALLLKALAVLAKFDKARFITHSLKSVVMHALDCVRRDMDRAASFDLLTTVISIVGYQSFEVHLDQTIMSIKQVFISQKRTQQKPTWEALRCLATVCRVSPPAKIEAHIASCIESVFNWGLSSQLIESMRDIIATFTDCPLRTRLEENLLDMISTTLCGLPFRQQPGSNQRYNEALVKEASEATDEQVLVALSALTQFGFTNSELMGDFLRDSVLPFFKSDRQTLRIAAVQTLAKLLIPEDSDSLGISRRLVVDDVTLWLLNDAVADPSPTIRHAILTCFTPRFYTRLSDDQFLQYLFLALSDEVFSCRSASLCLLCCLMDYSASHVLPVLRKEMVRVLHTVSNASSPAVISDGLKLLIIFAEKSPGFVVSFVSNILCVLVPIIVTLTIRTPYVLTALECFHAQVKAFALLPIGNAATEGIRKAVEILQAPAVDKSSAAIRLAAMRLLATLVQFHSPAADGGGGVYRREPQLFKALSGLIRNKDEGVELRLEALRVFGVIGALDPHRFAAVVAEQDETTEKLQVHEKLGKLTHQKCSRVVCRALATVIEPTNSAVAGSADSLIRSAMKTLLNVCERCCVSHSEIDVVFPPLVRVLGGMTETRLFYTILYETSTLVRISGPKALAHASTFLGLITNFWGRTSVRFLLMRLCNVLVRIDPADNRFVTHFSQLLPKVLDVFLAPETPTHLMHSILDFFIGSEVRLQPYTDRLVTAMLAAVDSPHSSDCAVNIVLTLTVLAQTLVLSEHVPFIIRTLCARLSAFMATSVPTPPHNHPFVVAVVDLFSLLLLQQPAEFRKFASLVLRTLRSNRIENRDFYFIWGLAFKGAKCTLTPTTAKKFAGLKEELVKEFEISLRKALSELSEVWGSASNDSATEAISCELDAVLPILEGKLLAKAKTVPTTRDEWLKWFEELSMELLRESPYYIFRCVSVSPSANSLSLAERAPEFVHDVLNIAFRCIWVYASPSLRGALVESFLRALSDHDAPDDVVVAILNIAEHMDMVGTPLTITPGKLSEVAQSKRMLAKALRWREMNYHTFPNETAQSLISLYSTLGSSDSAVAVLQSVSDEARSTLILSSLVKLGRYREALDLIDRSKDAFSLEFGESPVTSTASPPQFAPVRHARTRSQSLISDESFAHVEDARMATRLEMQMLKVRCLNEIGDLHAVVSEWRAMYSRKDKLSQATAGNEDEDDGNLLGYISPYAADAAVRLGAWDVVNDALPVLNKESVDYCIFQSCAHIVSQNFAAAQECIVNGRKMLLDDFCSLLTESYARAYDSIVTAQQLVELEEIVMALTTTDVATRAKLLQVIFNNWSERITNMAQSIAPWKKVLGTRGLLFAPADDVTMRILFVKLCRVHGRSVRQLERFTLEQLLGCRSPSLEHLLDPAANPKVVLEYVKHLSSLGELNVAGPYGEEKRIVAQLIQIHGGRPGVEKLEAQLYSRLGYKSSGMEAIANYRKATSLDPKWFRGWRYFADACTKFLLDSRYDDDVCADAIAGYINSIKLGPTNSSVIQDVLKLLSLWSRHCDNQRALAELKNRVAEISPNVWQLVVPQLIARLGTGSNDSCALVASVLSAVAKEFPQSIIYPLLVCTSSTVERRKMWANVILNQMKLQNPKLVAQGTVVSAELIRIAQLVYEQWYEKFEAAATAFFAQRNYKEMVDIMTDMHNKLNASSPQTITEADFWQKYARQLSEAREWLRSYKATKRIADLHSAWHIYHAIYKQIDVLIKNSTVLSLQYCSPKLWEARDLEVCLPDSRNKEGRETVRIAAFEPKIVVIPSKQRPKRITMVGSDGKQHKFLLKGHEDLRLDERVMQLFKLVNTLLLSNATTNKVRGFQIQRYSVTPLWDTVGLIGWVDECDTMHELVHSYRTERGIPTELELQKLIPQIITVDQAKSFDMLNIMSKVEVMEFLADNTSGQDLRKAMWASAGNSEAWVLRRTTFTTSLATMSVVGYILGLGDRHPNNIMIQRNTGRVVHIDFGDCFEVAMTRAKFPERVPFRLTRMLRNAMEVCGVDGTFRSSAETVMSVLRDNSDSVIAMLEAFIQDPLISWRLVSRPGDQPQTADAHAAIADEAEISRTSADVPVISPLGQYADEPAVFEESTTVKPDEPMIGVDAHEGVAILKRLQRKLLGQEFSRRRTLDPKAQVARLIDDATNEMNVAQSWSGWYPFW